MAKSVKQKFFSMFFLSTIITFTFPPSSSSKRGKRTDFTLSLSLSLSLINFYWISLLVSPLDDTQYLKSVDDLVCC